MEKNYFKAIPGSLKNFWILLLVVILGNSVQIYAQVRVDFNQRTSTSTPNKKVYNLNGDFTMIGNTNLTLQNYSTSRTNSNNTMILVDVDNDSNTSNSSMAQLTFSTENDANPICSNVVYAGLYWTGRTANNNSSRSKRTVKFKAPDASYKELTANPDNIRFPGDDNMYVAYVEVTDLVKAGGTGDYWVADMELTTGNGGAIGFYGGWGMVVIYENAQMNLRDVTVFDGYAFVAGNITTNYELPVSGFNTAQSGNVNVKLGFMAGEGDNAISGDYFQIQKKSDNGWLSLSHSANATNNFFNSSIETEGIRNPNLINNTGLDISMFTIPNANNNVIGNNQTSTKFRYGSTQDTYIIFNMVMSVDAYIPKIEGVGSITSINNNPVNAPYSAQPGEEITYKVEVKNKGTEAIDNAELIIPVPFNVEYIPNSVQNNIYFTPAPSPNNLTYNPNLGINGSLVWNIGSLPVSSNTNNILADLTVKFKVTTNCTILKNSVCGDGFTIPITGNLSGKGKITGTTFNNVGVIQGYQKDGACQGQPVSDNLMVKINATSYIADNCQETPDDLVFNYCKSESEIPVTDIKIILPEGSRIYNQFPINEAIEYNVSLPNTVGSTTYYATLKGSSTCYIPFIVEVRDTPVGAIEGTVTQPTCDVATGSFQIADFDSANTYNFNPDVVSISDSGLVTANGGTYNFTVTNTGGCTSAASEDVVVNAQSHTPDSPVVASTLDTTCDLNNGTISIVVMDGVEYSIDGENYQSTGNFDNLSPNNYYISARFINGDCISATTEIEIVEIPDTEDPVLSELEDININVDAGLCGAVVNYEVPIATDNCEGTEVSLTEGLASGGEFPVGISTVTYTATDASGNSVTTSFTVTVTDNEAPVPDVAELPTVTGECSATVSVVPTATDNCGGTINGTTEDALTYTEQGTYTVTWTFDDGNGNTSTQTQTVIVEDVTAPVANVAELPTVTGECSATVAVVPTATDNCGGTINGTTEDALTYTGQGTYTVTWTFDDGNGNITTQEQTVIVEDVTAPVADVAELPTVTGECSATVAVVPTATDNCGGTIEGTTEDALTYNEQGTYTVTWTFDDGNGNITTQEQTVIVDDVTAPVPDVAELPTVTGECSATVAVVPTATDNCGGTINGTTEDALTYTEQGTYTVTWTFDDGNGNTSTQTQTVIVEDVTAPVADVAELPTVTGECSATVAVVPTATDNCGGTINGTTEDALTYTEQGTYIVTWTFDDGNGNTSTQTQTIIVEDVTAPVADVTTLETLTGGCSVTVITVPTATDNCEGTIEGTTNDPLTYEEQGTFTITWTYDDGNGNTSTQTQTVEVNDTSAPVADLNDLPTITAECFVTVDAIPTATDNCSGEKFNGTTSDPLTYNEQGTYTITWTFDDGNGNTSTQTQTVIVEDVTAPVADVAELPTVTGECSATVAAVPTATDNCGGTIEGTTEDALTYNEQGTYTVTWTFDDGNGNITTQEQTVIVEDVTAPVADVAELPTVTGECSATVAVVPTATDNCGGTIEGTTEDALTYNEQGTYTVTWTFDDGNGNITTQEQTVIVDDVTAPVPDVAELPTVTGECSATVAVVPTATDNCGGTINGTTEDALTYTEQGTYTVTWTFDDGNGNITIQEQTVIVDDVTAPVADVAELPSVTGECSATVSVVPTATDNCGGTINGTTEDALTYTEQGTYTVTWTFDDGNGNTSTQTQTVIVEDVTAAVADVTTLETLTGGCSVTVT
ncbi:hypothetical protein DHB64_03900, partial [Antarcticibacterium sp. W02-3]